MLHADNTALADALEANDREFAHELLFDWNRDGRFDHPFSDMSDAVEDVKLDKSMSGALPPNTTLLEGTSASKLNVRLAGRRTPEEETAAVIFSPYNPASPFFNSTINTTPVRYSLLTKTAEGMVPVRQFTGKVTSSKVSSAADSVSLTCMDAVEDLQKPISLPAFGDLNGTEIGQTFSSHWALDRILRENGFYQTPPAHPDACFSATLHGGTCPELGLASPSTLINYTGEYRWVGGGSEPMYFDTRGEEFQTNGNTAGNRIPRPEVGNTIGLAWRIKQDGPYEAVVAQYLNGAPLGPTIPDAYVDTHTAVVSMKLNLEGTFELLLQNYYDTNTYSELLVSSAAIMDAEWHTMQGEVTFNDTDVVLRLKLDNGPWEERTVPGAFPEITPPERFPPYPYIEWPLWVQMQTFTPVTNIQTYCGTSPMVDAFPASFVPNSRLDAGINRLTAIPEFRSITSWNILKKIANAELGSLFVDEYGDVRFYNMHTARRSKIDRDREVDASTVGDVSVTEDTGNIVNIIQGTVVPSRIGPRTVWDASKSTTLYDKSGELKKQITFDDLDDFTVQPGYMRLWPEVTSMIWPSTIGRNTIPYYSPSRWEDAETLEHGVGAIHADAGTEPVTKPTVDVWLDEQNTLYVAVFNLDNAYAIQISNGLIDASHPPGSTRDGRSLRYTLKLAGITLLPQPEITYRRINQESIDKHGYKSYSMPSHEWTQDYTAMVYIADLLLDEMKNPVPLIEDITLPGDPRIQLGDTVVIRDVGAVGPTLLGLISAITRRVTLSGARDTYSLKLIHQATTWILGDPVYSVLGTSTTLSP